MSIEIRDWNGFVMNVLNESLLNGFFGQSLPVNETMSFRIGQVCLDNAISCPSISIRSLSNKLPNKFLEVLPPNAIEEEDLVPLYLDFFVDISLLKPVKIGCTLSLDKPIPNFVEFDAECRLKEFIFTGILEVVIYGNNCMFAIKSTERFHLNLSTCFGDQNSKQLQPANLDQFLVEKMKQAVTLLHSHPIHLKV